MFLVKLKSKIVDSLDEKETFNSDLKSVLPFLKIICTVFTILKGCNLLISTFGKGQVEN